MGTRSALDCTETLVALVEDGIDALEYNVSVDVESHGTTALDATVHHAISSISKCQIFGVDGELRVSDSDRDDRKVAG